MIMWEISAGEQPFSEQPFSDKSFSDKPFSDHGHDIHLITEIWNGRRPKRLVGTPECWMELMERCWWMA
jgi:hypothetical protein